MCCMRKIKSYPDHDVYVGLSDTVICIRINVYEENSQHLHCISHKITLQLFTMNINTSIQSHHPYPSFPSLLIIASQDQGAVASSTYAAEFMSLRQGVEQKLFTCVICCAVLVFLSPNLVLLWVTTWV